MDTKTKQKGTRQGTYHAPILACKRRNSWGVNRRMTASTRTRFGCEHVEECQSHDSSYRAEDLTGLPSSPPSPKIAGLHCGGTARNVYRSAVVLYLMTGQADLTSRLTSSSSPFSPLTGDCVPDVLPESVPFAGFAATAASTAGLFPPDQYPTPGFRCFSRSWTED